MEALSTQCSENNPNKSPFFPGNRLTSQHPPAVSFELILCFILIYFVYPLARRVLRQSLLCFTAF